MKRSLLLLCIALPAFAPPAFARVVSYAPYSNRASLSGYHERSTRWFPIIERSTFDWNNRSSQVVLHDSKGEVEPAVVYPPPDTNGNIGFATVDQVALYEPRVAAFEPQGTVPVLLVIGGQQTWFSGDGGRQWRHVIDAPFGWVSGPREADLGGPFVHGLSAQILPGNDRYPFFVAYESYGVYAIDALGKAKALFPAGRLAGRNLAADRFVIHWGRQLRTLDLEGNSKVIDSADANAVYSGWIRADGAAYVQKTTGVLRSLTLYDAGDVRHIETTLLADSFFAAPTHDFEGAWLVHRPGSGSTWLSRHTAAGKEVMWTDRKGPDVEALIAGASGQTLLVQVHRPREIEGPTVRVVDPALAVWRVGDPAPASYDELYLAEEWNKAFVHVDVDRLAAGDPFVFDAGFAIRQRPDCGCSSGGGGGADVIQEWGIVRGSLPQRLVLPGVARARGAFDSQWLTDVTVYNPLAKQQTVAVTYMPLGVTGALINGATVRITLEPQEIRVVADVLHAWFAVENGGGALHFAPDESVNVFGRTYSRRADGGTFGYGMHASDIHSAVGPRFPVTFAGAIPGEHFRTNLILTDTSGRGAAAEITHAGPLNLPVFVPAAGVAQLNGLAGAVGALGDEAAGLSLQPTRGTLLAGVVAIDNRTNDPTWFPPDLAANVDRVIPVVGHVDGANGSAFRSDLYLFNPEAQSVWVLLSVTQWGSGLKRSVRLTLAAGEARVVPDVLMTLFGMTGLAHLRYSGGARATSRTYNLREDGGTFGCLIPPLNGLQIAAEGDALELFGASAGMGFRTNLGLVNLADSWDAHTTVKIIDGTGRTISTTNWTIPAGSGTQINDLFARLAVFPAAAKIVVEVADGEVAAYATLTDNITNDSTYLTPLLGAKE